MYNSIYHIYNRLSGFKQPLDCKVYATQYNNEKYTTQESAI